MIYIANLRMSPEMDAMRKPNNPWRVTRDEDVQFQKESSTKGSRENSSKKIKNFYLTEIPHFA